MDRLVIDVESSLAARHANEYLAKHQLASPVITAAAPSDHRLSVVIPCYNELDVTATLDSLRHCERPACGVEIIVVVNCSVGDDADVRAQNSRTVVQLQHWSAAHGDSRLRCQVLEFTELPAKHAGVGLARKLGLDAAVARLAGGPAGQGVLLSLDADCLVDSNYLIAVDDYFRAYPHCQAANVYFEHDIDSSSPQAEGITQYELHLRYYVHGLRYAGFPFAQHTVGSSFAARSAAYCAQGGMNRRKAGEDFYFLQKLISLGDFGVITSTCVRPASRESSRVPFGTGRAMLQWQRSGKELTSYAPEIFVGLRQFFANIDLYASVPSEQVIDSIALPTTLSTFLNNQEFIARHREISANTASPASFKKRLLRWFNAFRLMKYINQANQHYEPAPTVVDAARTLLGLLGESVRADATANELLEIYRRRDRQDLWP